MSAFDQTSPGFSALRISLQDTDIRDLLARYPKLSRTEVTDAITRFGPLRGVVEVELARLSSGKR
jgi:hypothetical protein